MYSIPPGFKSKENMRDYIRTTFYPFSNENLKELIQ